jgi:hypothetical protein
MEKFLLDIIVGISMGVASGALADRFRELVFFWAGIAVGVLLLAITLL